MGTLTPSSGSSNVAVVLEEEGIYPSSLVVLVEQQLGRAADQERQVRKRTVLESVLVLRTDPSQRHN